MRNHKPIISVAVFLGLILCSACTAPSPPAAREQVAEAIRVAPAEPKTALPAGTMLRVRLYHPIDTSRAQEGQPFVASLSAPITVNDQVILPRGTVVRGSIQQSSQSGRLKGRGSVTLTLRRLE